MPHVLFSGGAGTGKTMLARMLGESRKGVGWHYFEIHGSEIRSVKDLWDSIQEGSGGVGLTNLRGESRKPDLNLYWELLEELEEQEKASAADKGGSVPQVLFIDEIHRLPKQAQEHLYKVMDDGAIGATLVTGSPKSIEIPPTAVLAATTDAGLLTQSLRDRFHRVVRMDAYKPRDIVEIGRRIFESMGASVDNKGLAMLVLPSRLNPRLLKNLATIIVGETFKWADDAGDGKKIGWLAGKIHPTEIQEILEGEGYDPSGLHEQDRRYLECLLEGGVSLEVLSMNLETDKVYIREVIEPFLSRMGLITRSSRGRELTSEGVEFLDREYGIKIG